MDEWCDKESYLHRNFSCGPVFFCFLLKIDILGLVMLIELYGNEGQVKFLQVLYLICSCFCMKCKRFCLEQQSCLPLNFFYLFATLVITIKNLIAHCVRWKAGEGKGCLSFLLSRAQSWHILLYIYYYDTWSDRKLKLFVCFLPLLPSLFNNAEFRTSLLLEVLEQPSWLA